MTFVSNCPAFPTNGSACISSSAPGASPTNISCALMSPTPKTTFLREEAKCEHLTQAIALWRKSANAAIFASGVRAGVELAVLSPGNSNTGDCGTKEAVVMGLVAAFVTPGFGG